MNVCGACERIQKSPISLSYRWFIRQSIAIYLLTLPWGLIKASAGGPFPRLRMLSYFMAGVEMIAEQIEDPFGTSKDDLMLDEFCKTIDQSVTDILDRPEVQMAMNEAQRSPSLRPAAPCQQTSVG